MRKKNFMCAVFIVMHPWMSRYVCDMCVNLFVFSKDYDHVLNHASIQFPHIDKVHSSDYPLLTHNYRKRLKPEDFSMYIYEYIRNSAG